MSIILKIGLVSIPIQLVNTTKNRYTSSSMHLFSSCCNAPVKNKQVCETCNKQLSKEEIKKGISKDIILTKSQLEALKNAEEGGILEVLGIKDVTETTFYDLIPFVQKCQIILPSISKGYRKSDIKAFYSFKSALTELNKLCFAKLISRSCEHIGVVLFMKEDLIFIELPFRSYSNMPEILSTKEQIKSIIQAEKISDLEGFEEQAQGFISNFKSRVKDINEISEEKKVLLNSLVEEIKTGIKPQEIKINEVNPFG